MSHELDLPAISSPLRKRGPSVLHGTLTSLFSEKSLGSCLRRNDKQFEMQNYS